MFLSANNIRKMVKLADESKIDELEISSFGRKIKITRRLTRVPQDIPLETNTHLKSETQVKVEVKKAEVKKEIPKEDENLIPIKSPMVGTFYRTPSPGAKPYVEVGQMISAGQVVCVIEAMKLMNELESEVPGRVVKILVENEKPVEFGQTLFLIEPI